MPKSRTTDGRRELPGPALDPEADARSRRRARKWWWATGFIVVGVVLWVLATGGESSRGNEVTAPRDFCRASVRYEKAIERQQAEGSDLTRAEISKQVQLVQAIVDTAPRRVRADAEVFLTKLKEAEAKGKKLDVAPSVKASIDNVTRAYAQGCAVYKRDGL